MRSKLTLNLEQLSVDSFQTTSAPAEKGTVFAEQCTCYTACTCPGCPTCDATCGGTCGNTCAASCNGTCNDATCNTCGYSCYYTDCGCAVETCQQTNCGRDLCCGIM